MNIYRIITVFLLGMATFAAINYFENKQTSNSVLEEEVVLGEDNQSPEVSAVYKEVLVSDYGFKKDLSGQGLVSVPMSIFEETKIEYLDLSNNSLTGALPGEIRLLKNIKVLDISQNKLTGVPAEVGQLENLEVLNLSGNPITGLPHELGNLKNLKVLDLTNTDYSKQDLEIIRKGLSSGVEIKV